MLPLPDLFQESSTTNCKTNDKTRLLICLDIPDSFQCKARYLARHAARYAARSAAIVGLLLGLGSCASVPKSLRLATGSQTGYYYSLGQRIEKSTEETVGIEIDVEASKGSIDNLQQLLAGEIDLALVQLDVAKESMRAGEVKAIAVLAQEHIHLISRQSLLPDKPTATPAETPTASDTLPQVQTKTPTRAQTKVGLEPVELTLKDLEGRKVAVGALGSGIRFTADEILAAARLDSASGAIEANESGFEEALTLLSQTQIDAAFYVGRLGGNEQLRNAIAQDPAMTLLPLSPSLINFLVTQNPGVYRATTIPTGIYGVRPNVPDRELTTLSTPTVLITRPDANTKAVQRVTWSILATARRYARFYPELHTGDPEQLLRRGLFHLHPAAAEVYEQGDPRQAWIRYWESNSDLQAGIFLLLGTSGLGMLLQYWRKRRSQHLIDHTTHCISKIHPILTEDPQRALREIEALSQDNRLQFIAGNVPDEVYAQVHQKTQTFEEQCHSVLAERRRKLVLDTLLLLDDWQETLQADPQRAFPKLRQLKQQYRAMLLSDQVDIEAYIELMELTLLSVMTLAPKGVEREAIASILTSRDEREEHQPETLAPLRNTTNSMGTSCQ